MRFHPVHLGPVGVLGRLFPPPPDAPVAFDALSKTQRYAVILKLLTARAVTTRAAQLRRAMTALEASGALRGGV